MQIFMYVDGYAILLRISFIYYGWHTVEMRPIMQSSSVLSLPWKIVLGEEENQCTLNFMSHLVQSEKNKVDSNI